MMNMSMARQGCLPAILVFTFGLLSGSSGVGFAQGLDIYGLASKPASSVTLPSPLREISGISVSPGGRIFAHNDERGLIFEVDPGDGRIGKQFAVGARTLRGDFEDICVVGDTLYLVRSDGRLYQFPEGRDRENVPAVSFGTPLNRSNNVEGLCYDPATGSLLLACKESPWIGGRPPAGNGAGTGRTRAVYAFDLKTKKLRGEARFLIDVEDLKEKSGVKNFRPSGIARHPVTGNFFVISGPGNSIIELSPRGKLLSVDHLSKRYNEQPEGIAFDAKGNLLIANEGKRKGSIVVYRPAGTVKKSSK